MREKMQLLMKNEGLTQSRLAEILEVQPAGISHILAGRNKPGFDLLQKILRRFPRLNPDWLLLDSDRMYRDETDGSPAALTSPAANGVRLSDKPAPNFDNLFSGAPTSPAAGPESSGSPSAAPSPSRPAAKEIIRVIVLYGDRSFESFTPPSGDREK